MLFATSTINNLKPQSNVLFNTILVKINCMTTHPFIYVANWKMYGLRNSGEELREIITALENTIFPNMSNKEIVFAPPATLISYFADIIHTSSCSTPIALAGQNCHTQCEGAYTGSISAPMLYDSGARYVLLGHSEVRQVADSDADILEKTHIAHRAGLRTIVCVGEERKQRESGKAVQTVIEQLSRCLDKDFSYDNGDIAYEPLWAIGAESPPSVTEIAEMHEAITLYFHDNGVKNIPRILYGGAVNENTIHTIKNIANVNGVLVGRASLKSSQFLKIIEP